MKSSAMGVAHWRPGWHGGAGWRVGMPVSFLLLSGLLLLPTWLSPGPRLIGYGADSAMHVWFLQWFPYAITHGSNPFITNMATAPQSTNILWNNADLLLALLAWPVVQLVGAATTLEVINWLLLAAAGVAMAWQLRPHVRHASAALLGGALFGFAPWMQSELAAGHVTMLATCTLPVGWWVGTKAWTAIKYRRRRFWWGLVVGLWLVVQYWADKELLATAVMMTVILLLLLAIKRRQLNLRAWLWRCLPLLVVGAVVALALLAVPLWMQFGGKVALGKSTVTSPNTYVIDLLAYFVPGYGQLLSNALTTGVAAHFTGEMLETDLYLGLPLILLLIWTAVKSWRRPLVQLGVALLLVGAIMATGAWPHLAGSRLPIPFPWLIVKHLPGYAKAVPARMAPFVLAGAACLLAAGWDLAMTSWRPRVRWVWLGLAVVTLLPSWGIVQGIRGTESYTPKVLRVGALKSLPAKSMVIVLPIPTRDNHGVSMDWQAKMGFRFEQPFGFMLHPGPGGVYTDYLVKGPWESLCLSLSHDQLPHTPPSRSALESQLRAWRISAIVDTPGKDYAKARAELRQLLGPPRMIDGSAVWLRPLVN